MYFLIFILLFSTICYFYSNKLGLIFLILKPLISIYLNDPNSNIVDNKIHIKCSFKNAEEHKLILPISYLPYNLDIQITDEEGNEISIISIRNNNKHHVIGLPEYTSKKLNISIIPYPYTDEESLIKTNIINEHTFINWNDVIEKSKEEQFELMEAFD